MNIEVLRKIDRIHPYPAKFTIDLALEQIEKHTKKGDTVYDPFVGSGTTMLAASVDGRKSYGTDINHIAVLISRFKLLKLSDEEISELSTFINVFEDTYQDQLGSVELFYYPSINHWFCDESILVLSLIKKFISEVENEKEQLFCDLVFSAIINTVSNQESDTRYAAIKKELSVQKIATIFIKKFRTILDSFTDFNKIERCSERGIVELLDSNKCCELIPEKSVDLLLTSPPYVNTYDYYLYHKHRMNWLGFDVKYSMEAEIGSRREYSSLKRKKEKFSSDLLSIFTECDKVLKENARIVLVMGDGRVAGEIYDAKENMQEICKQIGWDLVDYSYTFLDETSRSFQKAYRTKGKKEHILTFEKR